MKCVVILIVLCTALAVVTAVDRVEELYRHQVYKRNAALVDELNANGEGVLYQLNMFSQLTEEEFNQYSTSDKQEVKAVKRSEAPSAPGQGTPDSFDWRWFGAITPVSTQTRANGGSVWPAVAVMEAAYYRATGSLVAFSSEEICDCAQSTLGLTDSFSYVKTRRGLSSANYTSQPGACAADKFPNAMTGELVDLYTALEQSDDALINSMMRYPVLATMSGGRQLAFYAGGVFPSTRCGGPQRAMAVVGYAPGYYILKNSWGASWGEKGYIRLERKAGLNPCGLFNNMYEPETEPLFV